MALSFLSIVVSQKPVTAILSVQETIFPFFSGMCFKILTKVSKSWPVCQWLLLSSRSPPTADSKLPLFLISISLDSMDSLSWRDPPGSVLLLAHRLL